MANLGDLIVQKIRVDNKDALRAIDEYTGKATSAADRVTRSNRKSEKGFIGLQGSMLKVGAAGAALTAAVAVVDQLADRAGRLSNLSAGFRTLTGRIGETADEMLGGMSRATRGLVLDMELMRQANQAILLDIPVTAESMEELTGIAFKLSRTMGVDVTRGLESMISGIGRQERELLDNLGIVVSAEEAYRKYAEKIGVSTTALDDNQKKLAFYNETLAQGRVAVAGLEPDLIRFSDIWDRIGTGVGNVTDETLRFANEAPGHVQRAIRGIQAALDAGKSSAQGASSGGPVASMFGFADAMGASGTALNPQPLSVPDGFYDYILAGSKIVTQIGVTRREVAALQDDLDHLASDAGMQAFVDKWREANAEAEELRSKAAMVSEFIAGLTNPAAGEGFVQPGREGADVPIFGFLPTAADIEEANQITAEAALENLRIEQDASDKRREMLRREMMFRRAQWAQAAGSIASSVSAVFEQNKALQYASTIINTSAAVVAALAFPPGPPATIPQAVATAVAGAAELATIAKTNLRSGGGGGRGGPAFAAAGASAGTAAPVGDGGGRNVTVRVILDKVGFVTDEDAFLQNMGQRLEMQLSKAGAI